mgnify:FL=1
MNKKQKISIDMNAVRINSAGKLGRHNTSAKSHVHQTAKDKAKNRNSKQRKRQAQAIKEMFVH